MEEERIWQVGDKGRNFGPLTWNEITIMFNNGQISRDAMLWRPGWPQWSYVAHVFGQRTRSEAEVQALLPSRYESLIYVGFLVWFLCLFLLFISTFLSLIIMVACIAFEFYGLYLVRTKVEKTTVGLVGDIFMILIILAQVFFTVVMVGVSVI